MNYPEKTYKIKRHDFSRDRSLKAHSAADEHLLAAVNNQIEKSINLAIYNDRFGFLSCHLHSFNPITILTNRSQQKAIELNVKSNNIHISRYMDPLSSLHEKLEFALIKVPKSLALFELFLQQIYHNSTKDAIIIIAFMTRHFSPKILEIAEKYFVEVKQSKAIKKARFATLTKKKIASKISPIDILRYNNKDYKQYWGVFSAKHIDYATQYLLENVELENTGNKILDLASGNGVIGKEISLQLPKATIHLMDDFYLAVESAKLNIQGEKIIHHWDNDLSIFEDGTFDLIVSNPPFHFEYENNINITLQLFKECFRCLKENGNLQIIANKHLNYLTHLQSIFPIVKVSNQNDKFILYKCLKNDTSYIDTIP